jgi:hypothetical protein
MTGVILCRETIARVWEFDCPYCQTRHAHHIPEHRPGELHPKLSVCWSRASPYRGGEYLLGLECEESSSPEC